MIKIKKDKLLLRPEDIKPTSKEFRVKGAFNPGAIRLPNKDIMLYVRVWEKLKKDSDEKYYYSPRYVGEKKLEIKIDKFKKSSVEHKGDLDFNFKDGTKRLTFISHMRKVILDRTGFHIKSISQKPSFFGLAKDGEFGVEDPRITKIGKKYVMTYASLSMYGGVSTSYAVSDDAKKWKRGGIIFQETNKDVVVFPEKIKGQYVAIHRPEGNFSFTLPRMWICYSDDLEAWENPHAMQITKRGEWDSGRVGAGPPPIKTSKGWLLLYHGLIEMRRRKVNKSFVNYAKRVLKSNLIDGYYVGAVLLELDNPRKVIARAKLPILSPVKKYEESVFDNRKIIFPTGIVEDENKKDLLIYSGGGDGVVSVKKVLLKDIMERLRKV